jgi:hypothetical protein
MNTCKQVQLSPTSSPLSWWRSLPADEFGVLDLIRLHAAIRGAEIVGEPEWKTAVNGDAATAIGVAIRLAVKGHASKPVVDLAMTGVLAAAIADDFAAQHFLAHMLKKRGATELAASWIAASHIAVESLPALSADAAAAPSPARLLRGWSASTLNPRQSPIETEDARPHRARLVAHRTTMKEFQMFEEYNKPLAPITIDPAFLPHLVETVVRVVNAAYPSGLSQQLRVLADDFDTVAANGGPDEAVLARAPCLDLWCFFGGPDGLRLAGVVEGHPHVGPGPIVTSPVWLVDPAQNWARTQSRFFRLRRPASRAEQSEESLH